MKKKIEYQNNKVIITYDLSKEAIRTLFLVKASEGVAFENRHPSLTEDLDGNDISWRTCDDLVDMGLLFEDEEAHDLFYDLTPDGEEIIKQISSQK